MSFLPASLVRLVVDACTIGTGAGCIYVLGAAFLVHRFRRQTEPRNYPPVPVTIFKPLHGDEPGLYRRLAAFCNQSYAGPVQIIFGCHGIADPAIGTVRRLKENYPELAIELAIGAPRVGNNRKVCNLISMARSAKHNVFVISDSDIEVGDSYLADVVSPLQRPSVGAVTCFYHGVAIGKVPAYFSELIINAHFLPQVLLAIRFGLGRPCFGATIALGRETLQRIGNFHSFANNLADDHAIGEAVRAAGYEVAIPSFSVGHACTEETFGEFFGHLLRHARTIKSIYPAGYAGAIITNPLPLALIAMLGGASVLPLAAAMICRIVLCKTIEQKFGLSRQKIWWLAPTDLALFAVFICSFFGSKVTWRDHRYRILPDGTLVQIQTNKD